MAWQRPIALFGALGAIAVLALCGCGGSSPGQGQSSETQPSTSQSKPSSQSQEEAKGGEASVEEFGEEAQGAGREAILSAYEGYLGAIAAKDPAKACFYLAAQLKQAMHQLAGRQAAGESCAQVLPKLLSPSAPAIAKAQAQGKVTRVRAQGGRAFVLFHAPGAELYYLALAAEGGQWKVASAVASVLVPEL
jgi:hypothetical protein